jgi:hypothetical protein
MDDVTAHKTDKNSKANKNKAYLKAKIKSLIDKGRNTVINRDELKKYPLGSNISYTDTNDIFHSGGFLDSIHKKYFVIRYNFADEAEFESVYFTEVSIMYVGIVNKTKNDVVSIIKYERKKTNFPVYVGETIVYYASDTVDKNRFLSTEKYKRMIDWYNVYGNYLTNEDDDNE